MRFLAAILVLICTVSAQASEKISQSIINEYLQLREYVSKLEPDGEVGGYLKEKNFAGYKLLWKLGQGGSDGDRIRIYRAGEKYGEGFSVDYYTGTHFIEGQNVLRRFIGLERTGWRNHTIDLENGFYYGSQGASVPRMTDFDRNILSEWGITVFSR